MAKILVIDDEEVIRDILKRMLGGHGHSVKTLSDGAHAMEAIRLDTPELIILDVMMPNLDGMALAHHLKFDSDYSKIPILMLTSLSDEHTKQYSKESAVDTFLTKPFEEETLFNEVNKLLGGKAVKVGATAGRKGLNRRHFYSMNLVLVAILLVVLTGTALKLFQAPAAQKAASGAENATALISVFADRLFVFIVPLALIIILIQTYLLYRIYHGKGGEE
ncbi:MAG: response regulator [bacterium]